MVLVDTHAELILVNDGGRLPIVIQDLGKSAAGDALRAAIPKQDVSLPIDDEHTLAQIVNDGSVKVPCFNHALALPTLETMLLSRLGSKRGKHGEYSPFSVETTVLL